MNIQRPYRRVPNPYEQESPPYQAFQQNGHIQGPHQQQVHQPLTPFEYYSKPVQPPIWPNYGQHHIPGQASPSFLTQYQDENGQMDVEKVLSTVGQFANTVQQISPVIQQVSSLIKTFR